MSPHEHRASLVFISPLFLCFFCVVVVPILAEFQNKNPHNPDIKNPETKACLDTKKTT